jgi:hypothetical protein
MSDFKYINTTDDARMVADASAQRLTLNVARPMVMLHLTPSFVVAQPRMPNRFHRFMMKMAFGWWWEKIS